MTPSTAEAKPATNRARRRVVVGILALAAVLGAAVLLSVCSGSAEQTRPGLYDPPTVEADFGDASLLFLDLYEESQLLWRFNHIDHLLEVYNPLEGSEDMTIGQISRGRDPSQLYATIYDPTGVAPDQAVHLTEDGFTTLGSAERLQCLSPGTDETEIQAMEVVDEGDPLVGVSGVMYRFDTAGPSTPVVKPFAHRFLFCPVFSDDHDQVAFGLPAESADLATVGLRLQTGSVEKTWLWQGCAMIPWDFNSTGQRLAVAAECTQDADHSSGLYLFETEDTDADPTQIIVDRVGYTSWSPDDRWIAYVTLDKGADPRFSTRISAVELSSGDVVLVPFGGGSFPVWISKGDQLPGNWS